VHFLVVAASAGDEHQRHQSAADAQREHNSQDQRDPAMNADRNRIEAVEEPCRAGERQQQEENEETDRQAGSQS